MFEEEGKARYDFFFRSVLRLADTNVYSINAGKCILRGLFSRIIVAIFCATCWRALRCWTSRSEFVNWNWSDSTARPSRLLAKFRDTGESIRLVQFDKSGYLKATCRILNPMIVSHSSFFKPLPILDLVSMQFHTTVDPIWTYSILK
jgi:hypothetical protein